MTIQIKWISPAYRQWFNQATWKMEVFKKIDWVWHEETWAKDAEGKKTRSVTKKEPSFKEHKKVYDITVKTPEEVTIEDKKWDEIIFTGLGATKIKDMAEATVAFGKVPTKDDGTPEYDREEKFLDDLIGKSIVFSTKNKKMATDPNKEYAEFTFREGVAKKVESVDDDMPF